jgi:hypothetical protein
LESLQILQDNLLIKAYKSAVQLNLSNEFISLLTDEIEKRNLFI